MQVSQCSAHDRLRCTLCLGSCLRQSDSLDDTSIYHSPAAISSLYHHPPRRSVRFQYEAGKRV
ncbi:hypothetical protein CGRA01v4_02856 [Colletotrichum graminicola]|nr:hypothetical protein CGRA01v4_02856 [Colletotrichum graminicola]